MLNSGYTTELFDEYMKVVGDLNKDWIKHLFQYYQADRINKKQDFTPKCLGELLSRLADDAVSFYDCCAGTGSLTIEKHKNCPKAYFICIEFDENAIPFLLFNLAIRNISADVLYGDALSEKIFKRYSVIRGEKYGIVKEIANGDILDKIDTCISNPPYNIQWNPPTALEALTDERFNQCEVPPKSNANYAFILSGLEKVNKKACFILPNGILKSDGTEKEIRNFLVDSNLIESVILLPDKMFKITSISTCILVLNKNKNNDVISFVDSRQDYSLETRKQNGQVGSKAHTNRTYSKEYKVLKETQINRILSAIENLENTPEYSISVSNEVVAKTSYDIAPPTYIQFKEMELSHRPYQDIIEDLNFITRQKILVN